MSKSVFGFHCLHDCLCISAAAEPHVLHYRTSAIPLRSFFITSLVLGPRGKWPPMLHEPRGNTTPFGPKLSKYGPRPVWSCLPTPWGLAQGTVHHSPNSVNSSFIARAQRRQITMVLIFSAASFQTIRVFFNGKCYYQRHRLVQNANSSQGQDPLCLPLYWPGTGKVVLWATESTHLGSICLHYVTSISSLSFSQPLLETLAALSLTPPQPPTPVICIGLVIIIAYWKSCGWLWALPLG